ncbi:MAG TPA: 1-(5-phosphoribosyl)-5-[(5-phosphoribosylamino)methylideneamino]imidazole-4-carboxamide isomerase [Clostridiaceae bacterium]|jgi:phosphoribosylformimino-5-aminoimidazole carboxamide ribotide isomerase|nr:1-(5-phosphoribosyl)-5-[(5-phosphoribosylamino)methylideneamino]imidazole-4-carboxamide isomerase [Clostridiaceae bacterium]
MVIYPAIDIKDGKCVRLLQGRFENVTTYSDNLEEVALRWKSCGADWLHVVDLDGARTGSPINHDLIGRIAERTGIKVQAGGGIRSLEAVENLLGKGVSRVIIGTSAVRDPDFVRKAIERFGSRIIIGIDARDGQVCIDGWEKASSENAYDFAGKIESLGIKTIIYTDISRDGMLQGPNLAAMERMAHAVGIDVIASGGVGKPEDIINLKRTGVSGVIIGKALYTGNIDLKEAIDLAL